MRRYFFRDYNREDEIYCKLRFVRYGLCRRYMCGKVYITVDRKNSFIVFSFIRPSRPFRKYAFWECALEYMFSYFWCFENSWNDSTKSTFYLVKTTSSKSSEIIAVPCSDSAVEVSWRTRGLPQTSGLLTVDLLFVNHQVIEIFYIYPCI